MSILRTDTTLKYDINSDLSSITILIEFPIPVYVDTVNNVSIGTILKGSNTYSSIELRNVELENISDDKMSSIYLVARFTEDDSRYLLGSFEKIQKYGEYYIQVSALVTLKEYLQDSSGNSVYNFYVSSGKQPFRFDTSWNDVTDKPFENINWSYFDKDDYGNLGIVEKQISWDDINYRPFSSVDTSNGNIKIENGLLTVPDVYFSQILGKPETYDTDWELVSNKPDVFDSSWNSVSNKPFSDVSSENLTVYNDSLGIECKDITGTLSISSRVLSIYYTNFNSFTNIYFPEKLISDDDIDVVLSVNQNSVTLPEGTKVLGNSVYLPDGYNFYTLIRDSYHATNKMNTVCLTIYGKVQNDHTNSTYYLHGYATIPSIGKEEITVYSTEIKCYISQDGITRDYVECFVYNPNDTDEKLYYTYKENGETRYVYADVLKNSTDIVRFYNDVPASGTLYNKEITIQHGDYSTDIVGNRTAKYPPINILYGSLTNVQRTDNIIQFTFSILLENNNYTNKMLFKYILENMQQYITFDVKSYNMNCIVDKNSLSYTLSDTYYYADLQFSAAIYQEAQSVSKILIPYLQFNQVLNIPNGKIQDIYIMN